MEWSELKFWVPKGPCAEMTSSRQDGAASCTHNVWSFQGKGDNGDSTRMTVRPHLGWWPSLGFFSCPGNTDAKGHVSKSWATIGTCGKRGAKRGKGSPEARSTRRLSTSPTSVCLSHQNENLAELGQPRQDGLPAEHPDFTREES